ncbi:leucine-rich repeat domain-containing protein [Segatella copri]|uniref:leucine-rich repeat domain-containing protein n=1 Tax=Segatella copri TaxID=165179 RepID=UPI0029163BC6|nr:leucine-rich repeat domain-containing protein [Segatella copri]MDV3122437.1 leucine-rich repeat domain-containing protein [Segatella copri]
MEYYLQKKKIIKNREMRNFTFKGLFLAVVFMVLGSLSIQAADGLITKQITIKLDEAGTLPDKIGSAKRDKITNLKIIGEINGTDLRVIRYMLNRDTGGKLAILDLSEAKIVRGGDYYYYDYEEFYTHDNELGTHAFYGCSGLTSLTLPSGLTSIGSWAFTGCSGLTSLSLPSGVTSIGDGAFFGLSSLTSLSLPSGLTSIGDQAFHECSGLTSLSLPSGLTSIGNQVFCYCSGLTTLSLPSGITSIGYNAFYGCSGLTSIYVYTEKMPKLGTNMFDGCDAKKCTVYVPKGTYDDYWLSEFGYFENIVEFDPTGINNVITSNDAKELSRYSLNGQRLSAPTKGLNIVKYSDGSVKKVVVQ